VTLGFERFRDRWPEFTHVLSPDSGDCGGMCAADCSLSSLRGSLHKIGIAGIVLAIRRIVIAGLAGLAPGVALAADSSTQSPPPPPHPPAAHAASGPAAQPRRSAPASSVAPAPGWIVTVGIESRVVPAWPGGTESRFRLLRGSLPLFGVRREGTPPAFVSGRDGFGFSAIDLDQFQAGRLRITFGGATHRLQRPSTGWET